MDQEFQQYRFARIEGEKITGARLEARFKDGIRNLEEFEKAIREQMTTEPMWTPWRKSEREQAGCRQGMRMAALEFYCECRNLAPPAQAPKRAAFLSIATISQASKN